MLFKLILLGLAAKAVLAAPIPELDAYAAANVAIRSEWKPKPAAA